MDEPFNKMLFISVITDINRYLFFYENNYFHFFTFNLEQFPFLLLQSV